MKRVRVPIGKPTTAEDIEHWNLETAKKFFLMADTLLCCSRLWINELLDEIESLEEEKSERNDRRPKKTS